MAYTSSYQTFLGGVVKQKRGSEDGEGSLEKVRVAQVKRHKLSLFFTYFHIFDNFNFFDFITKSLGMIFILVRFWKNMHP